MTSTNINAVWQRNASSDLWSRTLANIPTTFGRLVYLSSLRDPNNGVYQHHGLAAVFGEREAHQALLGSHLRAFSEWLAFGLEEQKADLDLYISTLDGTRKKIIETWLRLTPYKNLIPVSVVDFERDLYLADLETLLQLLKNEHGVASPDQEA